MDANAYTGVRAEPKFLRDPTSLESISSGISRISSYVTSNLPKRKSSMTSAFDPQFQQQYQQQQQIQQQQQQRKEEEEEELNDMEGYDTITYASFDKLEYMNISCLLLGYHDGFQLWDITNPDNVHELCSIRDKDLFGTVSYIHLVKSTDEGPLLAIISETVVKDASSKDNTQQHNRTESNNSTIPCSTSIIIYSLMSQSIIKEIKNFSDEEDDTTVVTCIKSNHKVIVLGCLSRLKSSIHILSTTDFEPFASPLTDIYHDSTAGPIFTLGTRLIAYATNAAVLNSDPIMTSLTNKSISYTGFGVLQGEKDVKGAAKDIAKEVVSGMKTLGGFGYTTLSNYFGNTSQSTTSTPQSNVEYGSSPTTASTSSNRRTSSHSSPQDLFNTSVNTNTNTTTTAKKLIPSGMIMIRDILKLPITPTRNLSVSTVAHFRPHTHPVTCLNFNQAGTLMLSASKQGHTFHVFSILTNTTAVANASHLYSLSRGITDAQVEDCQFSTDSTWCAISTARGTTHVYAINPYGGKPEISGHVHGKVNNPSFHPFMAKSKSKATTLSSVVRIKQRRKMPGNLSASSQDDGAKFSTNGTNSFAYYGQPHYIPAIPPITSSRSTINKERRAKITSMFVSATKVPYLMNNSHIYNAKSMNENANNASVGSIKQQATSMLSSFGSSMSHLSYSPSQGQAQKSKWNDKSDTLMFGFDEEYDDSAKMINDEIGYQDLYSFHPDGILTLHRCWVVKTVVKKRENGRNLEKLDLSLREEDVAEWRVARNSDWDQVKLPLEPTTKKKKPVYKKNSKKLWLSNAEITTYASVPDDAPLWTQHQFKFQTFKEKDLQRVLNAGIIPATETMVMLKGMPEPVSSRIDRVRKTTTRIANDNVEENMEDALAELEDNISKAMQSSFSPSSNSISNSPAATSLKWLSSSANAAMNAGVPSPSSVNNKSFLDRNSSVSFEDAYLIHMGSGPSPEPSMNGLQHSSLIQFEEDMLNEDIIRLEDDESDSEGELSSEQKDVYSPDGDNEVAHPSESMFVEIRERKDSDGESSTSW
ncbi:hypothetical protein EDC94DRAFT_625046 [Helicostylum pulchrum]|nr:hypothetical protein EDC94DRAFT_625046 [Helicostylum pulchrum]